MIFQDYREVCPIFQLERFHCLLQIFNMQKCFVIIKCQSLPGKIILKFQGQHSYKEYSYKSKQNLLSCLLLRYVLLGSVHYCSCLFLLIYLVITKTQKKKKKNVMSRFQYRNLVDVYGLNGCKALPAVNLLKKFCKRCDHYWQFLRIPPSLCKTLIGPAWLIKGIIFLVAKVGMVMSRVIEHLKVVSFVVVSVVAVEGNAVSSKTMPCDVINSKSV